MSTVYVVGIDFGTSNSCVTFTTYFENSDGKLEPHPIVATEPMHIQYGSTVPTVVFMGEKIGESPLYGELAEEKAVFYPDLTRAGFKMSLGELGESGREAFLLPQESVSYLRSRVAEFVPIDQHADNHRVETIISHPVQWSADQREETRRAAIEAGFPNVQLEDESLAGLYAHVR